MGFPLLKTVDAHQHKGPLGDKIFSKTTTIWENGFEKTTTTYLHDIYPSQKRRNTYPQRKVSFLTPQETGSSASLESQHNLIIMDSPPTSPKQRSTPFPQNTCFKCHSPQHAVIHCPFYKCWQCNQTAPGHYQHKCLEHPKNQPHVFKDHVDYDDYISADADYNLSSECWITHPSIMRQPYAPSPFYTNLLPESLPSNYVFPYCLCYSLFYFLIPTYQQSSSVLPPWRRPLHHH